MVVSRLASTEARDLEVKNLLKVLNWEKNILKHLPDKKSDDFERPRIFSLHLFLAKIAPLLDRGDGGGVGGVVHGDVVDGAVARGG